MEGKKRLILVIVAKRFKVQAPYLNPSLSLLLPRIFACVVTMTFVPRIAVYLLQKPEKVKHWNPRVDMGHNPAESEKQN